MTLAEAYTALANVLLNDAGLTTWAEDIGGPLQVLRANRDIGTLSPRELPALVVELGGGRGIEAVGGWEQHVTPDLAFALVWEETDYDRVFAQKVALPDLVSAALIANATLGDTVDKVWLSRWEPDHGFFHPRHSMRFVATAELWIGR